MNTIIIIGSSKSRIINYPKFPIFIVLWLTIFTGVS